MKKKNKKLKGINSLSEFSLILESRNIYNYNKKF